MFLFRFVLLSATQKQSYIVYQWQVVTEDPSNKYWTTVDSKLENLRVKYPDPVKMSNYACPL
jgi:hypothetical protein